MAMYLSGAQPAADLLLPAGQLRHGVVAAAGAWRPPIILAGVVVLVWRAPRAECAAAGRRDGDHLGLDVRRERMILLALAALVTAAAVATCGPDRVRRAWWCRTSCGSSSARTRAPLLPLAGPLRRGLHGPRRPPGAHPGRSPGGHRDRDHRRAVLPVLLRRFRSGTSCERSWRLGATCAPRRTGRATALAGRRTLTLAPAANGCASWARTAPASRACSAASPGSCRRAAGRCMHRRRAAGGARADGDRAPHRGRPPAGRPAVRHARRGGRRAGPDPARATRCAGRTARPRARRRRHRPRRARTPAWAATRASCRSASGSWC